MKLDNDDPHSEFKRHFVAIVEEYQRDPSDKKQAKLASIVKESVKHVPELLLWFNAMFTWRNTQFGLEVDFRVKLNLPFEG